MWIIPFFLILRTFYIIIPIFIHGNPLQETTCNSFLGFQQSIVKMKIICMTRSTHCWMDWITLKLNGNLASKWLDLTFLTWFDLGTYFWSCWRNITQKYIGILVFNGDLENKGFHQIKEKITEKYSKLIEAGRLELVSAPLDYYPQYIFEHGKGTGR